MTEAAALTTVRGTRPVPPVGVFDAHGHLWIDPVPSAREGGAPVLADERRIIDELTAFRAEGGALVVDCQPPGCGRNLARLASISSASGVDVIASTGFHMPRYYPRETWPWSEPEDAVAERFVEELLHGVELHRRLIRAGVIKAAYAGSRSDTALTRLLGSACQASVRTGAAIVVHTERGAGVERIADLLAANGVQPDRVVLCHVDKRPDPPLHEELAAAGFLLEYDTFLREHFEPDRNVWPLLGRLLEDGYCSAVACGLDLADASLWRFGGAPVGMVGLLTVVRPRLVALGASGADIDRLLRANIAARLAVTTGAEVPA